MKTDSLHSSDSLLPANWCVKITVQKMIGLILRLNTEEPVVVCKERETSENDLFAADK